jgi:hypothetical protein
MEFLIIDCFNPTIEVVDFQSLGLKFLVITKPKNVYSRIDRMLRDFR